MKKGFAVLLIFIVLLVGMLGLYVLGLAGDESLYFRKSSLAYYLFIDPFIENVPRPKMMGEPRYYSSCGDGAKMPAEGISFESRAPEEEIYRQIHQYLIANGYQPIVGKSATADYRYGNGSYFISLDIRSKDGVNWWVVLIRTD